MQRKTNVTLNRTEIHKMIKIKFHTVDHVAEMCMYNKSGND